MSYDTFPMFVVECSLFLFLLRFNDNDEGSKDPGKI